MKIIPCTKVRNLMLLGLLCLAHLLAAQGYRVCLASFTDTDNATRLAHQLRLYNIQTSFQAVETNDRVYVRVLLASVFSSRAEAETALANIREHPVMRFFGARTPWVLAEPISGEASSAGASIAAFSAAAADSVSPAASIETPNAAAPAIIETPAEKPVQESLQIQPELQLPAEPQLQEPISIALQEPAEAAVPSPELSLLDAEPETSAEPEQPGEPSIQETAVTAAASPVSEEAGESESSFDPVLIRFLENLAENAEPAETNAKDTILSPAVPIALIPAEERLIARVRGKLKLELWIDDQIASSVEQAVPEATDAAYYLLDFSAAGYQEYLKLLATGAYRVRLVISQFWTEGENLVTTTGADGLLSTLAVPNVREEVLAEGSFGYQVP